MACSSSRAYDLGYSFLCSAMSSACIEPTNEQYSNYMQCDNCDMYSAALYKCHHWMCASARILCPSCASALHRPLCRSRHLISLEKHPMRSFFPSNELFGNGFCQICAGKGKRMLAKLFCDTCGGIYTCMECDRKRHMCMENAEHTRVWIEKKLVVEKMKMQIVQRMIEVAYAGDMEGYAGFVWDGSIALAALIEALDLAKGQTVCELGSGCAALPAIAAWMAGAKTVVASDRNSDALEMLEETINDTAKQHKLDRSRITALQFTFGSDTSIFGQQHFDLILASFLLYDEDFFENLAKSIMDLCHSTTVAYFTSHERQREPVFLRYLAKYKLHAERLNWAEIINANENIVLKERLESGNLRIPGLKYLESTSILRITPSTSSISLYPLS